MNFVLTAGLKDTLDMEALGLYSSNIIHSLKYVRSLTLVCKDIRVQKI